MDVGRVPATAGPLELTQQHLCLGCSLVVAECHETVTGLRARLRPGTRC